MVGLFLSCHVAVVAFQIDVLCIENLIFAKRHLEREKTPASIVIFNGKTVCPNGKWNKRHIVYGNTVFHSLKIYYFTSSMSCVRIRPTFMCWKRQSNCFHLRKMPSILPLKCFIFNTLKRVFSFEHFSPIKSFASFAFHWSIFFADAV